MIWAGSALGNWTVLLRALVTISPASSPGETRSRMQVTSRVRRKGILPALILEQ